MSTEPEESRRMPVPSPGVIRVMVAMVALVGAIGAVLIGARVYVLSENDQEQTQQIGRLEGVASAQDEALAEANRRLAEAGEPTVAVPEQGPSGAAGAQGEQGEPGRPPTAAEVSAAVSAYCSSGACAGHGPTAGQVATAVREYCTGDRCTGPAGKPGQDGKDGDSVTGPKGDTGDRGPGPTDAQVLTAVNTYCSNHGGCAGPAGPAGPAGSVVAGEYPCAEGQYVAGLIVNADGTITLACRDLPALPLAGRG